VSTNEFRDGFRPDAVAPVEDRSYSGRDLARVTDLSRIRKQPVGLFSRRMGHPEKGLPGGAIGSSQMSRAVVVSVFNLRKRERIRRRAHETREQARRDLFDHIEFFYNPQRKQVRNGLLPLIAFARQSKRKLQGV
jgi:hypothetical protein